jgi:hypothetical protein
MALPKLASAKYELTLPSTGDKVEYRPFLVKEEKALMMAQQAGDNASLVRAVEDIVDSCTFGKLSVKKLPFFDIEYIFIQLRAKSVGEKSTVSVLAPDDEETHATVDVNLSEIQCVKDKDHTNEIKITDTIGIVMKYPTMSTFMDIEEDETKAAFDIIKGSIDSIYDAENVYSRNDMDEKELDEFIESMDHSQFQKLQEFFDSMPRVKHEVEIENPKTGVKSKVLLQGLQSFFQ